MNVAEAPGKSLLGGENRRRVRAGGSSLDVLQPWRLSHCSLKVTEIEMKEVAVSQTFLRVLFRWVVGRCVAV